MPNPEPLALLAGESIMVDGAGRTAVIGALDTITADAFPHTVRPFVILCRCRFTAAAEARVVIERPDGATLLAFEPIRMAGPGDVHQTHTIADLALPAPGD